MTDFETPEQRARVLAQALLSDDSKKYHDDIKDHPSEDVLAMALEVVMPYFGSVHVPETEDGVLGGVMLTAEPVDRVAIVLRSVGKPSGNSHGFMASVYKPADMDPRMALRMLATITNDLSESAEAEEIPEPTTDTKH